VYTAFKDYYKLLEISFPATESEIKAAYRRMAREYHPDLHPEDPEHYTARFQAITEAYQTLSDPLKKESYDHRYRSEALQERAPVYYYDDAPEDTRAYRHRYTARKSRGVNVFGIGAFLIIGIQLLRLVADMAPVQHSDAYPSARPAAPAEINRLMQQAAGPHYGEPEKDSLPIPFVNH